MIHFKALKAAYHFSNDELKRLLVRFGGLRHLREAYKLKNGDKRVRVYVASAYDTLLNDGCGLDEVLDVACVAQTKAQAFFNASFEFYVPVLTLGRLDLSRDEAMKKCFNELGKSTFLFIADTLKSDVSEGIYSEYKFARQKGIGVIFENHNTRKAFLQRYKNETL